MASAGPSKRPRSQKRKTTAGQSIVEPPAIITIREGLTKDNFPWLKKFEPDIKKPPRSIDKGVHVSYHSCMLYQEWVANNRLIIPLKLLNLSNVPETSSALEIVPFLEHQGWTSLWSRLDMQKFSREHTRLFYSNLWVTPQSESQPFSLNSFIDGTPLSFTVPEICEVLRIRNEGLTDFSVFDWSSKYGVPEQDVKFDLGYYPSKKTQNMPLVDRILLAVVTYCINGKATRNPSNMDFYVSYRLKHLTQLNLAWIIIEVMFAALRKGSKALPFANIVTILLKSKGIVINDDDLSTVAKSDLYDHYNIAQAVDSQKRKATTIPDDDEVEEGPPDATGGSDSSELLSRIAALEQTVQQLHLRDAEHEARHARNELRMTAFRNAFMQISPWALPPNFDDLGGESGGGGGGDGAGGGAGDAAGGAGGSMGGFTDFAASGGFGFSGFTPPSGGAM